jgi:hypothetical protein
MISGIDTSTVGSLLQNASIRAGDDIGSVIVKGGLIGNWNADGDSPVIISARGQAIQGAATDVAIGRIAVGGRVENARILAGYGVNLLPMNADAQIGAVSVGGDWIASDLAAGVIDAGDGFGNNNDAAYAVGNPAIKSRIASVAIKGQVLGTPAANGADRYGFVAQQIGSFKALGVIAPLTANLDVIELALTTNDITIREVV